MIQKNTDFIEYTEAAENAYRLQFNDQDLVHLRGDESAAEWNRRMYQARVRAVRSMGGRYS